MMIQSPDGVVSDGRQYYVTTWDIDKQKFTPQKGVRSGPYTLMGLRAPLRRLRELRYDIKRDFAPSVLVEKR